MLYKLLKIFARLVIKIYCRKIKVNKEKLFGAGGPLILAVNHPDSFLDAIILATLFDKPIHSLARGDAFTTKKIIAILHAINILPVYRQREGSENLHRNYATFNACVNIFKQQGIVLIFIEALSENEWKLRPLKKGTARLAMAAWQQDIPVRILPLALNYSSFRLFGKNVHINFGDFIKQKDMVATPAESGKLLNELTAKIEKQLQPLVYNIDKNDAKTKTALLAEPVTVYKKIILGLPAVAGLVTHAPLYLPAKWYVTKKYGASGHYDAILIFTLLIVYPFYLLGATLLLYYLRLGWWWVTAIVLLPFFAWSYVQLSKQIDD